MQRASNHICDRVRYFTSSVAANALSDTWGDVSQVKVNTANEVSLKGTKNHS